MRPFDFLGLKNLTLITNITDLIKKNRNINIVISDLVLDDEKTFLLLQRGDTVGVFQLESNGIKDVLRRLKPTCFEEIIAVNALYRPGPLSSGMVDDFIERIQAFLPKASNQWTEEQRHESLGACFSFSMDNFPKNDAGKKLEIALSKLSVFDSFFFDSIAMPVLENGIPENDAENVQAKTRA